MSQRIVIDRYSPEESQTIGKFYLLGQSDSLLKEWDSMELPWLNNQQYISCVPIGIYTAIRHYSPKFGECLWIQDVPGRSEILVHYANYHYDLLGCIGIGQDLAYIDQDKDIDITSSRKSMRELMELIEGDAIEIEIK
jgi:hypothetical protein